MDDPLAQPPRHQQPADLFTRPGRSSTSDIAAARIAPKVGGLKSRILAVIQEHGPLAIYQVAEIMGVQDHDVSQRFSEMVRDGLLELAGERRVKPATGNPCEVYRVPAARPSAPDRAEALGYPPELIIDGTPFRRSPANDSDTIPGYAYEQTVGIRQIYRVAFPECPGCGRHLKLVEEAGPPGQPKRKTLRCGTSGCSRVWHPSTVRVAGGPPELAFVLKTL